MSSSIRFLGAAILVWAAVRAVSLGIIPGTRALAFDAAAAQPSRPLPPIMPTELPPIEPIGPPGGGQAFRPLPLAPPATFAAYPGYGAYPVYVPVAASGNRNSPPQVIYLSPPQAVPNEVHIYGAAFGQAAAPTGPALAAAAAAAVPTRQSTPNFVDRPLPRWRKNLSISSWALMRDRWGSDSLASGGGMLGGSEAGARIMWKFTPNLAASLRASAPVNSQRGAEAALGIRYQPFAAVPVAVTLERRHGFRDYGRNAFAVFAEGGIYGRPLVWDASLDGYFQAGVVDFNNPDWFVDGQLAATRPVFGGLSAGAGIWGAAQPGLHRLEAGPRVSLRLGSRIRAHVDYRHKLTGNAQPGSGAVVTLAGDF